MSSSFSFSISGNGFSSRETGLYLLLAGFFLTLYLPAMPVINNVFIGLLFAFSFLYHPVRERIRRLRQRPAVLLMILFYMLLLASAAISQNQSEGWRILGMRSPLLLFPLAIGTLSLGNRLKYRVMLLYADITTLAALACLLYAVYRLFTRHNAGLLYNDSLSEAIGKQSVYFALMVTLAIFFYVYLLFTGQARRSARIFIPCALLLLVHFLLASRTEIGVLYGSAILFSLYYVIAKRNIRGMAWLGGLVVFFLLGLIFFPKTFNRFRELRYSGYQFSSHAVESHYNMPVTADQWNGMNLRLAIWNCSWELCRKHLIGGVPLGDKREALVQVYREKQFDFAAASRRNTHNNYLDVLSNLGLFGLLIFLLAFFILPLRHAIRGRDGLGIFVLAAFAVSLVTETFMDRSLGCVLIGFFISWLMAAGERRRPETAAG